MQQIGARVPRNGLRVIVIRHSQSDRCAGRDRRGSSRLDRAPPRQWTRDGDGEVAVTDAGGVYVVCRIAEVADGGRRHADRVVREGCRRRSDVPRVLRSQDQMTRAGRQTVVPADMNRHRGVHNHRGIGTVRIGAGRQVDVRIEPAEGSAVQRGQYKLLILEAGTVAYAHPHILFCRNQRWRAGSAATSGDWLGGGAFDAEIPRIAIARAQTVCFERKQRALIKSVKHRSGRRKGRQWITTRRGGDRLRKSGPLRIAHHDRQASGAKKVPRRPASARGTTGNVSWRRWNVARLARFDRKGPRITRRKNPLTPCISKRSTTR